MADTPARSDEQAIQEALGTLEGIAEKLSVGHPAILKRLRLLLDILEADLSYIQNPKQLIQYPAPPRSQKVRGGKR